MIKQKPRIFMGWYTALTGGILMLWGQGYHWYGLAALFKPLSEDLGLTRAATSMAASIGRFEGGFINPVAGWMTDRFGPRWVVFAGIFLMGLGLVLMNFINSLWSYLLVWGVILGTGGNLAMGLPLDTAISNWFVRKRGLALSIKWVFAGLSGVVTLPVIAWMITVIGWRLACVIGGLVLWGAGLPLTFFFVKRYRPEYYGLMPDGAGKGNSSRQLVEEGARYAAAAQEFEFTFRQTIRTPAYWLMIMAGMFQSLAEPAIALHGIPFLTDYGMEPGRAAGVIAVMALASIPSRLLGGLLVDRTSKQNMRFLLAGANLLKATGLALFLLFRTEFMIYAWFILQGCGMGISYSIAFPVRVRYFGRKAIGKISGLSALVGMPVSVVVPVYLGWVYDRTGSYISAFQLVLGAMLAGIVVVCFILPPKIPLSEKALSR